MKALSYRMYVMIVYFLNLLDATGSGEETHSFVDSLQGASETRGDLVGLGTSIPLPSYPRGTLIFTLGR